MEKAIESSKKADKINFFFFIRDIDKLIITKIFSNL